MPKYDFTNPQTVKSLKDEENRFEHLSEFTAAEVNQTERSLSGQLILLTTVLITVSMIIIGSDGEVLKDLTHTERQYVFAALLLEVVATISGIINYLRIEYYFTNWAEIYYYCAWFIKRRSYKNSQELDTGLGKALDEAKERKFRLALWVQIGAIIISLGISLMLVHNILFYTPTPKNQPKKPSDSAKILGPQSPFLIKPPNYP